METKKSYYERNKEKCKQKAKEYIAKHKDKHAEYMKRSREKNKDKWNKYLRSYKQKKYNNDEQARIKANFIAQHNFFLKGKNNSMHDLIGLRIEEYIKYIESLFERDMNWSNRGKAWRIVRKKGYKEFDLTNEQELKNFFNYKNIVVQRINS